MGVLENVLAVLCAAWLFSKALTPTATDTSPFLASADPFASLHPGVQAGLELRSGLLISVLYFIFIYLFILLAV